MNKKKKLIIIASVCIVVIGAIAGALMLLKSKNKDKKSVVVYNVSDLQEYGYDYGNYMYGYVEAGMTQNVYLSQNQKIESIKVSEGQTVKAGDVLLVYDTTAQTLNLDMKRADVEIARTAVIVAERELEDLKNVTPVEDIPEQPSTEDASTEQPSGENTATPSDAEPEVKPEPKPEPKPGNDDLNPDEEKEKTYTKAELDKAIKEKEAEIKKLKIDYQIEQSELEIMEYQNQNGEVVANFDGVITTLLTEEEALLQAKPLLVLSGEKGCTVVSSIGELSLDKVSVGDPVDLNCYDNGMYYQGTISEISTTPTDSGYSSETQSNYPIKITVEDSEGLSPGMGLDVSLSSGENADDYFYLPLPYVMKENGRYYVMKDNNGVLEKAYVSTGKIWYGNSIKIYSGVTADDKIAFPYAKDAVEGAKTTQGNLEDLYN